jgi:hypothetical protein
MAAATAWNMTLFAGGLVSGALLRILVALRLFSVRPPTPSSAILQVVHLMLWTCITQNQGNGRRLASAWGDIISLLHLFGTWPCSQAVGEEVRFYANRGLASSDDCLCILSVCECCGASVMQFC